MIAAGPASEAERLHADFVTLCEIASPSRSERACAAWVGRELRDAGLQVSEDGSGARTGSDSGNLYARIPGPEGAPVILLCAHLDTVPLAAPVAVELEHGVYVNRNEAILGADNKAAVAVILALARRAAASGPPVGIELLFTTCEELALLGAREHEHQLRAAFGFVFDHASPIGELATGSPSYFRVVADIHGAAAHAGIRPEDGNNAIVAAANAIAKLEIGRIDSETTTNVGVIVGGDQPNVVAERCRVELETRSLDDDRAAALAGGIVDAFAEAASDLGCDVETSVDQLFRGYRLARSAPPVRAAAAALQAAAIEPVYINSGGGSDANVFVARGLPVLNVANGTLRNHQPDEAVPAQALDRMLEVAAGIVEQSAKVNVP